MCLGAMAWFGLPLGACADVVGFSVRIQDELRVADVEVVDKQGIPYIPLSALVKQVGGGCTVAPGRVQVDLAAKTAWLRLNSREVSSSLGDFTLNYPILEAADEALIAFSDAVSFFDKAFFLDIRPDRTPAQPPEQKPEEPPTQVVAPEAPVRLSAPAAPSSGPQRPVDRPIQVIILDPGHGGADTGCQGSAGAKESALTLALAQKLLKALQAGGDLTVTMTREKDQALTRHERVTFANAGKGDLIVSLHCGASLSQAANGFEIFCCNADDSRGQESSNASSSAQTRPGNAYAARSLDVAGAVSEALAEQTRSKNRGVHSMPCAVLSDLPMWGLLIEVGFLTNPAEETLLQTDAYQDKLAQGIAAGIKRYLEGGWKGKGPS